MRYTMTSENNILNILKNGMFEGNSQSTKTISKNQLMNLQEKAEKYENLKSKYEVLKSENEKLKEKVNELKSKDTMLESVQKESERHLNSLKRVTADFENYRKRKERQNEVYEKRVRERILKKLINHYEDLQRAKNIVATLKDESVKKGFEIIIENYKKLLKEEGLEKMECEGQKFDPYKHEALMVEENKDIPQNIITEVFEDGYLLDGQVIKPAKVKVSKKSC
ncbi:MAG: nucleotide exchange factor GrpE [Candidatus Lokiarchaeota archaeon]|nr:nucleotide exchange factor GrpE [Candidatus Lokiarchaeota archaeon]MBD3338595.1 nucleotide exchange factor GrpE [Candidatus Lokiarchaeota archaeon]